MTGKRGVRRRVERTIRPIGRWLLLVATRLVILILIVAVVVGHALGVHLPPIMLWLAGGLFFVLEAINLYERGFTRIDLERRIAIIHGSLAGDIDSLTRHLADSPEGISEDAAKRICTGLLHRIQQYGELLLNATPEIRLRASLAVPVLEDAGRMVSALRVWAYDQSYDDRHWTTLRMGLAGSPTAFSTGRVEVIYDLKSLPEPKGTERRYRSVLSIPVTAGGPDGERLAVVSLDAAPVSFFGVEQVEKVVPTVMPIVASIGLVLLSMGRTAKFTFGR